MIDLCCVEEPLVYLLNWVHIVKLDIGGVVQDVLPYVLVFFLVELEYGVSIGVYLDGGFFRNLPCH